MILTYAFGIHFWIVIGLIALFIVAIILSVKIAHGGKDKSISKIFSDNKDSSFCLDSVDACNPNVYTDPSTITGMLGEEEVYEKLKWTCSTCGFPFRILRNVYLPNLVGTTEIDIILIHATGVYVIESKNYQGWIFGNLKDSKWTQALNKNTKERFPNPVLQNNGHIQTMLSTVGNLVPERYCYSVIVFGKYADLKRVPETNSKLMILNSYSLENVLPIKFMNTSKVFNEDKIEKIYESLLQYTNVTEQEKQAHIDRIKLRYGKIS